MELSSPGKSDCGRRFASGGWTLTVGVVIASSLAMLNNRPRPHPLPHVVGESYDYQTACARYLGRSGRNENVYLARLVMAEINAAEKKTDEKTQERRAMTTFGR